jgi:hypothetical protein
MAMRGLHGSLKYVLKTVLNISPTGKERGEVQKKQYSVVNHHAEEAP